MKDIVALLEARNEEALIYLKKQYGNYCYSIAYGILRDHEEAQEVVNDVWLRIWQSVPPAKPNCIQAYVAKVCRNTALDRIKCYDAQKRKATKLPLEEIQELLPAPYVSWDEVRELKEILNRFIKGLKPEEQKLFLRRYWYNETIEELADCFGCSSSKVAGILFRVRKKLRKYLEKEGYPYE